MTRYQFKKGNKWAFKKGSIPWNTGKKGLIKVWNKGLKGLQSWHNLSGLNSKGGTPWNKGKTGGHLSENTKYRISISKKGKTPDNFYEMQKKGWEAIKGNTWNKGRKFSEARKKKMSEISKGLKLIPPSRKGIKHTKETKNKISIWCKKNPVLQKISNNKRKIWAVKHIEIIKRNGLKGAQALWKRQPTSIEIRVYQELKNRRLLFETQKLINGKFIVDAYIPSLNLIIEADGKYWHNLDRIKRKDKAENAYLKKCGYNLLRLSEIEINNGSFINKLN